MPSDWNAGTLTGTSTNVVYWACQGRSYADDAIDQVFGTAVSISDTLPVANDLAISSATSAITATGARASKLVQFRVYRDDLLDDKRCYLLS